MTAHNSEVIGEGANVDFFAEAYLLGLCFEALDLMPHALAA